MKLMSLFDGSGGFPLAASLCGIEPVYAARFDRISTSSICRINANKQAEVENE